MIVVLDASAAVRVALNQPFPAAPLAREAELVIAPQLIISEVTNTVWKYWRAGQLSRSQAEDAQSAALSIIDEFVAHDDLAIEALHEAITGKRAAYDMFYFVLARRRRATLLTADTSFAKFAMVAGLRVNAAD